MKKNIIAFILFGLLIFLVFALFQRQRNETDPSNALRAENHPGILPSPSAHLENSAAEAAVQLVPRTAKTDPNTLHSSPRSEYVWHTQPTSKGAIKNLKGEVIFQATEELPFISMRSKTGISRVVIVSGNRNAFVIDPETKQRTALPKQPPGDGTKGFETWEWINNNTLIAEYHVQAMGGDGKPVGCCEGHSIAQTKLYAYNLNTNTLVEVALPKPLKGTAFTIGRVASDGSIEVVQASNHLSGGNQVGWFEIATNQK
ncbi:hypothetical protein [Verrucomicrobium sp. BvORR034]|uniref:hypothetical protein n=1 Tax=Verrucomicrobium sp. BvORR034 TaxID=1396418 RepID=UPI0006791608|nr:hypothetical protein [Verrucomicrobium sp. BvORR034]